MLVSLNMDPDDLAGLKSRRAGAVVAELRTALLLAERQRFHSRLREAYRLLVAGHVQDGIARLDAVLEEIGEIE